MSTLHIFSKPLNYYSANSLSNLISLTDSILVVGDACFAKEQYKQFADLLYVLKDDATARGISCNESDKAISYEEFVTLSLSAKQLITW